MSQSGSRCRIHVLLAYSQMQDFVYVANLMEEYSIWLLALYYGYTYLCLCKSESAVFHFSDIQMMFRAAQV